MLPRTGPSAMASSSSSGMAQAVPPAALLPDHGQSLPGDLVWLRNASGDELAQVKDCDGAHTCRQAELGWCN